MLPSQNVLILLGLDVPHFYLYFCEVNMNVYQNKSIHCFYFKKFLYCYCPRSNWPVYQWPSHVPSTDPLRRELTRRSSDKGKAFKRPPCCDWQASFYNIRSFPFAPPSRKEIISQFGRPVWLQQLAIDMQYIGNIIIGMCGGNWGIWSDFQFTRDHAWMDYRCHY